MFAYRRPLIVVRIGKIANERQVRAPMRVTRNEARNATSFPTNKSTNISTNKSTNKPTFFNNVFEGVVRTQEEVAGQRDARHWHPRSDGRMLKNVGFLTLLAPRRSDLDVLGRMTAGADANIAAPKLTSVAFNAGTGVLKATGSLTGTANATYTLDFYASDPIKPQGRIYLGSGQLHHRDGDQCGQQYLGVLKCRSGRLALPSRRQRSASSSSSVSGVSKAQPSSQQKLPPLLVAVAWMTRARTTRRTAPLYSRSSTANSVLG